ncbi:unnamed protein product [Sympodiomycopsis kandeliae]
MSPFTVLICFLIATAAEAAFVIVGVREDIFSNVHTLRPVTRCPEVEGHGHSHGHVQVQAHGIVVAGDSDECGKHASLTWTGTPSGSDNLTVVGYGAFQGTAVVSSTFAASHGMEPEVDRFWASCTVDGED